MKVGLLHVVIFVLGISQVLFANRAERPNDHALAGPTLSRARLGLRQPNCSEPDRVSPGSCDNPGLVIQNILEAANSSQNISDVINALSLLPGTVMGANESVSAQQSTGAADPRIFIYVPCAVVTITLTGQSIEVGVLNQLSDPRLREDVGGGPNRHNFESRGEILVDLSPFPRGTRRFRAQDVVNMRRVPPEAPMPGRRTRHDTLRCSACHVDAGPTGTGGSYGQRNITVGHDTFPALVSPYDREPEVRAEGNLYCMPEDLRLLQSCRCGNVPSADPRCRRFDPTITVRDQNQPRANVAEMCRRLEAILRIRPRQHCQFDPRRAEDSESARCFSSP